MSVRPNDVVVLNSGGPYMTVTYLRGDDAPEDTAVCIWFDAQHHVQSDAFWVASLVPAYDGAGNLTPNYAPTNPRPKPSSDRMAVGE